MAITKGDILCVRRSGALHVVSYLDDERVVLRPPLVVNGVRIAKPGTVAEMMDQQKLFKRQVDYS